MWPHGGEAALQQKWTYEEPTGYRWQALSVQTVVDYLKLGSMLATIGTVPLLEEVCDPATGIVRREVKQDILLLAIQTIQARTRKALGRWSQVHWIRRAPFADSFQEDQEPRLVSESPILHMNSADGVLPGHPDGRRRDTLPHCG